VAKPQTQQRESFAGYYDRSVYDALFRWIDIRKRTIIRAAFADLPPGAMLFDLGCGSGKILSAVSRPGDTAIAADLDLNLLQRGRRRGVWALALDFDGCLPIADGGIDGATIIDAIEHTESPRHILDELHRVLRPGGTLVVFTPPYDSHTWIAAEKAHNFLTRRKSDHISPFTRESLTYAVGRRFADFRIGRVNLGLSMYAVAVKGA
jgi:ubiquinone/menaquinone biosynthesis C-methylase UbiE